MHIIVVDVLEQFVFEYMITPFSFNIVFQLFEVDLFRG